MVLYPIQQLSLLWLPIAPLQFFSPFAGAAIGEFLGDTMSSFGYLRWPFQTSSCFIVKCHCCWEDHLEGRRPIQATYSTHTLVSGAQPRSSIMMTHPKIWMIFQNHSRRQELSKEEVPHCFTYHWDSGRRRFSVYPNECYFHYRWSDLPGIKFV